MYKFPRKLRLTHRREFTQVFDERCTCADANLIIYIRPNGLEVSRLGLSVGRKVGGAIVRSRCKRLIRESFRLLRIGPCHPGYDVVCIPRPAQRTSLDDYRASLQELFDAAVAKHRRRSAPARTSMGPE